jgi:uncharacterized caspase-like protein
MTGRLSLAVLITLALLVSQVRAEQQQPDPQWRDVQHLLKQNGFTGILENNDRSDWASNTALNLFCRNFDCAKYQKPNPTPMESLEGWREALQQALSQRNGGRHFEVEIASVSPDSAPAYFVDSGQKIASFDGDNFGLWDTNDLRRLSFYRLGNPTDQGAYYGLTVSADKLYSAIINKFWITVIDNRSGLIVGWLPLPRLPRLDGFENVRNVNAPAAQFLSGSTKLLVARQDGLVVVFDWVSSEVTGLRAALSAVGDGEPFIAANPSNTEYVVGIRFQPELLIVHWVSGNVRLSKTQFPNKIFQLEGINETLALFSTDGSSKTGYALDLATGRAQPFKAESTCKYAAAIGFRDGVSLGRNAKLNNGNLSYTTGRLNCDFNNVISFDKEICRTIPCPAQNFNNVDLADDGNKVLLALESGFALLNRNKTTREWSISLSPTLGPIGLSSDANGAPFSFSKRGKVFNAEAISGLVRVRADLGSASIVAVANAPSPKDWIALSSTGELTVARDGAPTRRLALSEDRDPTNAQLFIANNGRTAVVVLPTAKNPTSRDWGGSDVAVVDLDSLTVKRTFRVNPITPPKNTPQIWVLSTTTATILNDGRHLAISIFEPIVQIYEIQTGRRVKTVSTTPKDLGWASSELASSKFAGTLKVANEIDQRLHSSPSKLSPHGQRGLTISLGITGFINTNMIAATENVFSVPVTVVSILKPFKQVLETANPDEYLILLFNGWLFAKIDASGNTRTTYDRNGISTVARLGSDGLVYAISPAGIVRVFNERTGELIADLALYDDGEWLIKTPEGFFDASKAAGVRVGVRTGPAQVIPVNNFYDALHRPDLVREKLAGDPQGKVREAAAKLDLTKALASGKAPRVTIESPASAIIVSDPETAVASSIADQGGGIGKIEWRVNGTTVGVDVSAAAHAQTGSTITVRRTLVLSPGENKVEVVAYNAQGIIASDPAEVVITLHGPETRITPRLYVVAVGVSEYWDSRLRLAFAVPDAQAVGDALRKGGEGLYERIESTMLLDEQATAANIDRVFSDLGKNVRSEDVFVFFMAGHGKTVDGRFYFIPQDFRYTGEDSVATKGIGQEQLQQWLARIPARKSILMFDACESGTLTEERVAQRGMEEMTAIDRLTHAIGRSILTATTDDKPAMEGIGGHGVFTYAILAGFAEAHADQDGLIDVFDLAAYVDRSVPELSFRAFKFRQVPQTKIVGSNFPLTHRIAALPRPPEGQGAVIPVAPTHVVIAPATVHKDANDASPEILQLGPGTQVRLIQTSEGWVFIAREGIPVGYVDKKVLARIQ